MAVRVQVIATFVPLLGVNPATLQRVTDALANAGLTPKGKRGGGVGSAPYFANHLKNVFLGSSAMIPSDAVDAVAALDGLTTSPPNQLQPGSPDDLVARGQSLGDFLVQEITRWASPTKEMLDEIDEQENPQKPKWLTSWFLDLMPSLPLARHGKYREDRGRWEHDVFLPARMPFDYRPVAAWRTFSITLPVLKAAGELLADSLAKRSSTLIPDLVPGRTGEGSATPETMKAFGTGIREGLQLEQSVPKAQTAPVNKAQSTAEQGSKQLPPASTSPRSQVRHKCHKSATVRTNRHGTYWTDAASPQTG